MVLIIGKFKDMLFKSLVEQINSTHAVDFVCQSRGPKYPILASFINQKIGKDLIGNQGCKTLCHGSFAQRFNLIHSTICTEA